MQRTPAAPRANNAAAFRGFFRDNLSPSGVFFEGGSPYLQDDGRARLLLQHPGGAQHFERGVGVVDELGVVVDQQGLDVVEDEAELVRPLHGVQPRAVLGAQGGSQAGQGRGIHHLAHLGEGGAVRDTALNKHSASSWAGVLSWLGSSVDSCSDGNN